MHELKAGPRGVLEKNAEDVLWTQAFSDLGRRFIRKWVAPILIFNVPKGCSAVSRRWRMACGFLSTSA
jgi:hypothetical protein